MSFAHFARALGVAAALATSALGQNGNDKFPSNGGEIVFLFSDPSVGGATPGSVPQGSDLAWNAIPSELAGSVGGGTVELDSLETVFIGDSDWTTPPRIFDIGIGRATPLSGAGSDSTHVPDHFTTATVTTLISLGLSGLPNPCSIPTSPSMCMGTGCPPPITGFQVDILIGTGPGSGVVLPSDPLANDSMALTIFLPGAMIFTSSPAGNCGLGDYEFTGAHSTDEHQADATPPGSGNSFISGFQVGSFPTGPIPEDIGTMLEIEVGFAGNSIEASVADVGYPPEEGLSGMVLDATTGTAMLGAVIHDLTGIGGIALAAASTSILPVTGGLPLPAFGPEAFLSLDAADPVFTSTLVAWAGTGPVLAPDGEARTILLPVPPTAAGIDVTLQGFVLDACCPLVVDTTDSFRVRIR